jgi:hypothetical protein
VQDRLVTPSGMAHERELFSDWRSSIPCGWLYIRVSQWGDNYNSLVLQDHLDGTVDGSFTDRGDWPLRRDFVVYEL